MLLKQVTCEPKGMGGRCFLRGYGGLDVGLLLAAGGAGGHGVVLVEDGLLCRDDPSASHVAGLGFRCGGEGEG